jgi:hypothetical protein
MAEHLLNALNLDPKPIVKTQSVSVVGGQHKNDRAVRD